MQCDEFGVSPLSELVLESKFRESGDSPTHCELSWIPGGSIGFLIYLFGFFELTMVVVREREVKVYCRGDHAADDNKCPFWHHRCDKQWHANKAAEVRSGRANRSTINGPSGGSQ